jgi:hypothetical protein
MGSNVVSNLADNLAEDKIARTWYEKDAVTGKNFYLRRVDVA